MSMGRRACAETKRPRGRTTSGSGSSVLTPRKIRKEAPFVVLGGEFAGSPGRRRFQGAGAGGGEARLQWAEKSPEVRQCEQ